MRTAEEYIDDLEVFAIDARNAFLIVEFEDAKTAISFDSPTRLEDLAEYLQGGARPIVMWRLWIIDKSVNVQFQPTPEASDDPEVLAYCDVELLDAVTKVCREDGMKFSINGNPAN